MEFHGARFSNYEAWLTDPINIKPSAQVVWPIVGQDINADVGGGFHEFKSPPACSTFGDLLVLQIHSSFIALPLAAGGSSDAVCWLVSLSQARSQTGMVPECGVDAEPPPSWVTRFGLTGLGRSPDSRFFAD